jgi:hypothetical protein
MQKNERTNKDDDDDDDDYDDDDDNNKLSRSLTRIFGKDIWKTTAVVSLPTQTAL